MGKDGALFHCFLSTGRGAAGALRSSRLCCLALRSYQLSLSSCHLRHCTRGDEPSIESVSARTNPWRMVLLIAIYYMNRYVRPIAPQRESRKAPTHDRRQARWHRQCRVRQLIQGWQHTPREKMRTDNSF
jgi:hypothetical protein